MNVIAIKYSGVAARYALIATYSASLLADRRAQKRTQSLVDRKRPSSLKRKARTVLVKPALTLSIVEDGSAKSNFRSHTAPKKAFKERGGLKESHL